MESVPFSGSQCGPAELSHRSCAKLVAAEEVWGPMSPPVPVAGFMLSGSWGSHQLHPAACPLPLGKCLWGPQCRVAIGMGTGQPGSIQLRPGEQPGAAPLPPKGPS